jgi:hypothetical protein
VLCAAVSGVTAHASKIAQGSWADELISMRKLVRMSEISAIGINLARA